MRINLIDNNKGSENAGIFLRKDVSALFPIADKTIAQLCKENEKLLIFPYGIEESNDKVGDTSVMTLLNTSDPDKVRIQTGNVMGFIGVGNLQVKIKSRFDEGRDDYLLHYMLQKVLSFNFFNLNHNNEKEDVFDFVMFLFPYFLKNAMRQGIYREYQTYRYNDANIKGTIDLGRHLSHNMPFVGKVAYCTREYAYDNSMTELIRHTIEFMKFKKYGQSVLNIDRETMENVNTIIEHTPSYNKNERNAIISKNLRQKTHPYYTAYQPLQSLCLQILRLEEIKYGETEDEICGILFDGAWLWEEYVAKLLPDFKHPNNRNRKGGISLFTNRSYPQYPDFYNDDIVLDAKYKHLENSVGREDIHQLVTYLYMMKKKYGGYIYPYSIEDINTSSPSSKYDTLRGYGGEIYRYGIEVCNNAKDYLSFCNAMRKVEETFQQELIYFNCN